MMKANIKLFPVLMLALQHEALRCSGYMTSHILKLRTRCWWLVILMLQLFFLPARRPRKFFCTGRLTLKYGTTVQSWNFGQQSTGDATQHHTKTENSEKPSLPTKQELGWAPELVWMLYSKARLSIRRVNKTRWRGKEDKNSKGKKIQKSENHISELPII